MESPPHPNLPVHHDGGAKTCPQVSVLIPAYDEEELIGAVIDSVNESFAGLPGVSYETIVCDNNSSDGTVDIARSRGASVCFEPHNQIARARNTAARHSNGQWLIFLDADTFLNRELLRVTLDNLRSGKIAAGGAILEFGVEVLAFPSRLMLRAWNAGSALLGLAAGSYIYCLREAWVETGGFDEQFYAGEEIFFSRQLKRWARRNGLRFQVITSAAVTTSARKFAWFSRWHILRQFISLGLPGRLKLRARCGLWYDRPKVAALDKPPSAAAS